MKQIVMISGIAIAITLFSSFVANQKLSESVRRGKEVYTLYCQSCHMEDGKARRT